MLRDLVVRSRSVRRFHEEVPVDRGTLRDLVDLARHSPSGANIQPLRYILICDPEKNARIFPLLSWAGYLKEWPGPVEGERPSAYIVILGDKRLRQSFDVDHGIASQSILLGATERGLGGCIIATIQRPEMRAMLGLEEHYEILLVLALGKPKEQVVLEPVGPDGDIKYWRDAEQVHHVPKRSLDDLIIG
jgi:nitroreductase